MSRLLKLICAGALEDPPPAGLGPQPPAAFGAGVVGFGPHPPVALGAGVVGLGPHPCDLILA
jgi:hypothetical protein